MQRKFNELSNADELTMRQANCKVVSLPLLANEALPI